MNEASRPGLAPRGIDDDFGANQTAHLTDDEIERGLALREEKIRRGVELLTLTWEGT